MQILSRIKIGLTAWMGFNMENNKIELNCKIHGEYQKFVTDQNRSCPYCQKQKALDDEARKKVNTLEKERVALFEICEVTVDCPDHGLRRFKVPKSIVKKVACPECAKLENKKNLKEAIGIAIDEQLFLSGIPRKFLKQKFQGLDYSKSEKQKKIVERLRFYLDGVIKNGTSSKAKNIIFSGNMGTGKTLFMSCLMANITRRSLADHVTPSGGIALKGSLIGFFITEALLKDSLTETWGGQAKESQKQLLQRLANKPFLCIDDVGVTMLNSHLIDFYNQLIDERYKNNLPTFITTNLKHNEIHTAIGSRAADRLLEKDRCIVFNFDWRGYREANDNELEIF